MEAARDGVGAGGAGCAGLTARTWTRTVSSSLASSGDVGGRTSADRRSATAAALGAGAFFRAGAGCCGTGAGAGAGAGSWRGGGAGAACASAARATNSPSVTDAIPRPRVQERPGAWGLGTGGGQESPSSPGGLKRQPLSGRSMRSKPLMRRSPLLPLSVCLSLSVSSSSLSLSPLLPSSSSSPSLSLSPLSPSLPASLPPLVLPSSSLRVRSKKWRAFLLVFSPATWPPSLPSPSPFASLSLVIR